MALIKAPGLVVPGEAADDLSNIPHDPNWRPTRNAKGKIEPTVANFPRIDLTNPDQFRFATRNLLRAYEQASPAAKQKGASWYGQVHDAVTKGVRRTSLSHFQGSGLVAAVSPGMDWESNNIDALKELQALKPEAWDAIHRSAASGKRRSAEAAHHLKGLSIATAPDANLVKAHQILQGHSVEDVLPRNGAPKTNSFAWDIHDPSGESHPGGKPFVTIDGRQYDIAENSMKPWNFTRGISEAAVPEYGPTGRRSKLSGGNTPHERMESANRTAAEVAGVNPIQFQATTWEGMKQRELGMPGARLGPKRQFGPSRTGQPYFPDRPTMGDIARSRSAHFSVGASGG